MKTITLVQRHNPFDPTNNDRVVWEMDDSSLLQVAEKALPAGIEFAASINGCIIAREEWCQIWPQSGDMLVFVPLVSGGGDGKSIGRIVGMVVLCVLAAAAQQYELLPEILMAMGAGDAALMAATGIGYALTSAAIMTAGGMLINTLLPMPAPKVPSLSGNNMDNSQSYAWQAQTIQAQGPAIPIIYGTMISYGNVLAGYIETNGDKQYRNALIGVCKGLVASIHDIKINDQDYTSFTNVEAETRLGRLDQEYTTFFQDTPVANSVATKVLHATPVTYTVPAVEVGHDGLKVNLSFPQGISNVNELTGQTVASYCDITVEIKKTTDSAWTNISESRNDWILQEPNGVYVVKMYPCNDGVAVYELLGGPYTTVISNRGLFTTVTINGGQHKIGESINGGVIWNFPQGGNYRIMQTNVTVPYTKIWGHTASLKPVPATFVANNLDQTARYEVRVTRVSADITSDGKHFGDLYVSTISSITSTSFTYPGLALVSLRALATDQLSGSFRFSCMVDGKICRVFNGDVWSYQATSNPAWIAYDILTQPLMEYDVTSSTYAVLRYDGRDPSTLDLAAFVEWAAWCNDPVPDGNTTTPGTEPRFTFNGVFDSEMVLWDALLLVCQVGGAAPLWRGTMLSVAIDKPTDPSQLFSVGNIGVNSFKETFLPMEDRAAEIEVDFINAATGWQRDKLSVINPDVRNTVNKVGLQMVGCTSASQAYRTAMRRLKTNQYVTRTIELIADIDAIACTVGDVILVQHDLTEWGVGGRLVSASGTTLVLDTPVTMVAGRIYTVMVRYTGATGEIMAERTVVTVPGTTSAIMVTVAFADAGPVQYDVWSFGETVKSAKPFRVITIGRRSDLTASIGAVEYVASIYEVDDGLPVLPPINYSMFDATIPQVAGLQVSEQLIKEVGGGISNYLEVSWERDSYDMAMYPVVQVCYTNYAESGVVVAGETYDTSLRFKISDIYDTQTLTVFARLKSSAGMLQDINMAARITHFVTGKAAPPADVAWFVAIKSETSVVLQWHPVADIDLKCYEIRNIPTGGTWATGSIVAIGDIGGMHTLPHSKGHYQETNDWYISARDTSGNVSQNSMRVENVSLNQASDDIAYKADGTWVNNSHIGTITATPENGLSADFGPYISNSLYAWKDGAQSRSDWSVTVTCDTIAPIHIVTNPLSSGNQLKCVLALGTSDTDIIKFTATRTSTYPAGITPPTITLLWTINKQKNLDIVAAGDILIGHAPAKSVALSAGAAGQVLTMSGGVPAWMDEASGPPGATGAAGAPGASGLDSILVTVSIPEGLFFKNSLGSAKHLKADVSIGGVVQSDSSHLGYNYKWLTGLGELLYIDASGNFVQLTAAAGLYPADPDTAGGLNFRTIAVDAGDVATDFTVAVYVSNII